MTAIAVGTGLYVALVHAPDGVRFTATASCGDDLARQLVDYIAERCDDTLWPATAREVSLLIAAGRDHDAIDAYFANVGQRWDEEWLETRTP
jgi:hypothetical protein